MPLYIYIGHDGPRGAELRKLHRPAHLASLEPLDAEGRIRHAGPLLDAGDKPVGSVILFEAESLEAARAIAARDPYVAQGIFERHEVYETRAVFPR
ncbi:MAG TPA: YciI family protein [Myxococcota bacterium]